MPSIVFKERHWISLPRPLIYTHLWRDVCSQYLHLQDKQKHRKTYRELLLNTWKPRDYGFSLANAEKKDEYWEREMELRMIR